MVKKNGGKKEEEKKPRFKKSEMHGDLPSNFFKKSLIKNAAQASQQTLREFDQKGVLW